MVYVTKREALLLILIVHRPFYQTPSPTWDRAGNALTRGRTFERLQTHVHAIVIEMHVAVVVLELKSHVHACCRPQYPEAVGTGDGRVAHLT